MAASRKIDWAAVRAAYEDGGEPVKAIRARFGISEWEMRVRREAEGWQVRRRLFPVAERLPTLRTLHRRIAWLIGDSIDKLQARIADEGFNADTARLLAGLCRAQETAMRATRTPKSKTTKTGGQAREAKHHDGADRTGADDLAARAADLARKRADLKKRVLRIRRELGLE